MDGPRGFIGEGGMHHTHNGLLFHEVAFQGLTNGGSMASFILFRLAVDSANWLVGIEVFYSCIYVLEMPHL